MGRDRRARDADTIERNPIIKAKYRVLSDAAAKVAAPRSAIRARSAGNASQDATLPLTIAMACPATGPAANACYADTPEGVNREHALFDTDRAWRDPSDTGPALVALDAKFVIRSSKGASG